MSAQKQAIEIKQMAQIQTLFGVVPDNQLWDPKRNVGFVAVPRTLPLLLVLMDSLCSGKPVSSTYLALWCRCWTTPLVTIGPKMSELALESGFAGPRARNSLSSRLCILKQLEFVRFAEGSAGQYHYALLLNPYHVLARHRARVDQQLWHLLRERTAEIGAKDLDGIDNIDTPPSTP